jgi:16S rRNA processing protein RimM
MADFVAVGKISGVVGLKGEVRVTRWTDFPDRFSSLKHLWIGPDDVNVREFVVERIRESRRDTVLKLGSVESRSDAEKLRNHLLLIPDNEVMKPPEGSFLVDDVLGMMVVTEEGKRVGTIRDILRLPSNDLWEIDTGTRLISVPAVKEFIRKVDIPTKTVVIHEVEGLLDL